MFQRKITENRFLDLSFSQQIINDILKYVQWFPFCKLDYIKKSGREPRVFTNVFQNIKHTKRGFNFFMAIYNSTKENNEICNLPIYYLYKKEWSRRLLN
jgi:hypothetical protein